jgi:hypothetical protein
MIAQPLLGTEADVKATGSRSVPAGYKAVAALALCVVFVGAIRCPPDRIQQVPNSNLELDATDSGGRDKLQNFMSGPTQKIPPGANGETRGVTDSSLPLETTNLASRAAKNSTRSETSKDAGRDTSKEDTSVPTKPTEIPPDVLKEAIRDITGLEGAARCVGAFLFDREASSACASANPELVAGLTVVLSLYVLFFFAPFYMFPEACVALSAWKLFPTLEEAIMALPKDRNVPDTMRTSLLLTALVAVISRCLTLWKERNEPCAAGRQSSMLTSLVVGFVLYMLLNYFSAQM